MTRATHGAKPFALEAALVGKDGRETGEQHEDLGRVGEAEVTQREMGKPVVGDVIDEDEQQREPAEKIDLHVYRWPCSPRLLAFASNPATTFRTHDQGRSVAASTRPAAASSCGDNAHRQRRRRCGNRAAICKLLGKIDLRWAPR